MSVFVKHSSLIIVRLGFGLNDARNGALSFEQESLAITLLRAVLGIRLTGLLTKDYGQARLESDLPVSKKELRITFSFLSLFDF